MKVAKIIYINLDQRTDRRAWIEEELDKMMPGVERERFAAISTPEKGIIGCSASHLEVIKKARRDNLPNVMVVEDDFTFVISKEELEKDLDRLSNVPFDICMLGYNLIQGEPCSEHNFLTKAIDVQTTSAYIIQESMYDRLIDVWETSLPLLRSTWNVPVYALDISWKSLQPSSNWYCFTRRVGKQRSNYSDIEKIVVDYGC